MPLVRINGEYYVEFSLSEKYAYFSVRLCKVAFASRFF
jgi:hypothetical protein